jgi:hypothetical protein
MEVTYLNIPIIFPYVQTPQARRDTQKNVNGRVAVFSPAHPNVCKDATVRVRNGLHACRCTISRLECKLHKHLHIITKFESECRRT